MVATKGIYKRIPVKIYDRYLHVSINQTDKELTRDLLKKKVKKNRIVKLVMNSSDKDADAWTTWEKGSVLIRFHMTKKKIRKDGGNIISHEVFHAVMHMLTWLGMPLADPSEEAYAWLIGYLNREVNKIVND